MKVFQEQYRLFINANNYRMIIKDNSPTIGEYKYFTTHVRITGYTRIIILLTVKKSFKQLSES